MISFDKALGIVESELKKLPLDPEPANLYEPIRYVLAFGGKRIRPVLTLMCSSLFDPDPAKTLPAALAIEVFHNFTLLHDDIIDKADLRRKQPTVHVKWNSNIAILSGDAMLIKAYELLSQTSYDKLKPVMDVFNKTAIEVCEGQQYDMDFENIPSVTVEQYLQMIGLKTSVLLAASMKIGALAGGADAVSSNRLYEAGRYMGLAFQLQDDWLDSFGNQQTFGKKIGGDITANKKTYLFIKTLEAASEKDRQSLLEWYSSKPEDPGEKIEAVKNLFRKYHTDIQTQELIIHYSLEAKEVIGSLSISPEDKAVLWDFIEQLMGRKK